MDMDERAKAGDKILAGRRAQGEPGTKQPTHSNPQQEAQDTIKALDELRVDNKTEVYGPSSERAKKPGNLNPTPPEERTSSPGPAQTSAADLAAGHVSAAKTAIEAQLVSDAQLKSDPRYERDQEVYELSKTGKLNLVPPPENETPKSVEEQVADDEERLQVAKDRMQEGATGTAPLPGGAPVVIGTPTSQPQVVK